jgi:flagellar hook-length control protein FliK
VRSTGTPVDRTAAPVPTDAAPAKVEQSATTIEPEATRLDGTSPRLTVDQATRPHAAQTLRYEIERPREFQVPGQIRVRIDPPELGQVRVDITSSRDGIIGTLRFESPQAREMVGRDLANLHRTLTDAGIRVERLDIVGATSGDSRTSFHQSTSDQQHGFHSFSRGSSQGQSQGGRYTQQHGYAPQNHTPTRTWSADAHETVWQPPAGMMMQVNLVA